MNGRASLPRLGTDCRQAFAACLATLSLLAALAPRAQADDTLDDWRREVAATRRLAENSPPQAHEIAHRLHSFLPVDAPPADRARILNLLARLEIYLARPEEAAIHTEDAEKIAHSGGDKVGQAEANLNWALIAINQGRLDTMATAAMSALTLLEGVDRPDLLGEAMLRVAMLYRRRGQIEASVTISMQALDIAQRSGDPTFLTHALNGMAISMDQSGRYAEAHAYYVRMVEQARLAGSKHQEAYALLGKSGVEARMGRHGEAETSAREAIHLFRTAANPFSVAHSLFSLAEIVRAQGRREEALRILDEVIAIYERYPNKIGLWWALNTRSADRLALGLAGPATDDAEQAYALAKDIGAHVYLTATARQLAALAAARGDFKRAYEYSVEATRTAAEGEKKGASQHMDDLMERYQTEAKQKQIEALTRQTQHDALEQRWLWTILAASFLFLAVTGAFLVRQRRSHRLLKELNAQAQQASRRLQATLDAVPDLLFVVDLEGRVLDYHSPRTDLLYNQPDRIIGRTMQELLPPDVVATCMASLMEADAEGISMGRQYSMPLPRGPVWFELSVARKLDVEGRLPRFIMLARDITERKEAARQLEESRDQIRELAARQESAREEERRHIAREIHDELGQQLTALRLKVNLLNFRFGNATPGLKEATGSVLAMVDQTIQVARNVSTSLRPSALDMGIASALDWLAANFQHRTGIPCELGPMPENLRVEEDLAMVLFRVAQESLTNAARYSEADRVRISFEEDNGCYVLEIADNGKGFDAERIGPQKFGLVGMRERALAVGGTTIIDTAPGQGTRVRVTIPISN